MQNTYPLDPKTPSPSVAMVGLLGAGKTILASTMANRLITPDANGVQLIPQNHATMVAVRENWTRMQNREWADSTRVGTSVDLRWKIHIKPSIECEFRVLDVAGQDLLSIFQDDRHKKPEELDEHKRTVLNYCKSADIVLFLVNFADFIGEGDQMAAVHREAAMKSALDCLIGDSRRRRVCFVFTQAEQFNAMAKERGGWLQLAKVAMPFVYSAHFEKREFPVFPVSAVYDTETINAPGSPPRRVPKPGFRSFGIDRLVQWMAHEIRGMVHQSEIRVRPSPVMVQDNAEWKGLMKARMTWTGVIRNDGAAGYIRVIAIAQRNGTDVEARFQDVHMAPGATETVTIRLTDTTDQEGRDGVSVKWKLEVP